MGKIQIMLKQLCKPAYFYFILSIVGLFVMVIQNIGNHNKLNVGSFSCNVPSTILVFIFEFLYILFWTYILNLICKDGHSTISWLLVLVPWILFFVILGLVILNI